MAPRFLFSLLLACWLALPAFAQQPQDLPRLTLHVGSAEISAQAAVTPLQRETGLMHVRSMPDNDGMIFAMPSPGPATFWMKDTLIPLSIAYLDKDGVILEIHDMKAMDETIIRSTHDNIAYALEANLHWFSLNGVKPGDKVTVPGGALPKPINP